MNWSLFWTGLGSVAAVLAVFVAIGVWVAGRLKEIREQNRQQLAKQDEQRQREDEFRRDWYGTPARPGVPPESGVMERLGRIESNTSSLPDRMAAAEGRLVHLETALTDHIVKGHGGA